MTKSEYNKKYREENRERLRILKSIYHKKNKDHFLKLARVWRDKPLSQYRLHLSKFKGKTELTEEQFISFWQKPCFYCGKEIEKIGLDRVDNNIGYRIDNIVPCCKMCNISKNKNTKEQFFEMCLMVVKKQKLI